MLLTLKGKVIWIAPYIFFKFLPKFLPPESSSATNTQKCGGRERGGSRSWRKGPRAKPGVVLDSQTQERKAPSHFRGSVQGETLHALRTLLGGKSQTVLPLPTYTPPARNPASPLLRPRFCLGWHLRSSPGRLSPSCGSLARPHLGTHYRTHQGSTLFRQRGGA